ncbi:hypothetical protein G6F57_020302 [Rhizopus arrhizus]|nr:hypothetical protein G6F57_020302 [Rhizopus arrhizus]
MRGRSSTGRQQLRLQRAEDPRQPLRPCLLSGGIGNQVLADFQLHVHQAAAFAMHRHCVVAGAAHRVRLVVAHHQVAFVAQRLQQCMRKSRVLVVQHAGLPRPLHAVHHRGEAVHHHQQGGAAGISARVQFGVDARVVRRVDRIDALLPLRCRQPDIGWHHGVSISSRE